MPINYLHSRLHRVEDGFDPIPKAYAANFAAKAWGECAPALVDSLELRLGGLEGRRVLDLGGGPGQYSVLFAQRGARVTWHDISREYQAVARERAEAAGVTVHFSLGYLDDARRSLEPFDLVFCRGCWYYSRSDRGFSGVVYSLVKPGGLGYVECQNEAFSGPRGWRRAQYWINRSLGLKLGHPSPPQGRIARLLQRYPVTHMTIDYSNPLFDVVTFSRP